MTIISTLPVNIQNGTVEDATQVMSNFNWIVSQVNANAVGPGANSTITSLSGLTTALSVSQGGTGSGIAATGLSNLGGLAIANNLSDLASAATARTNLGLGSAALLTAGTAANDAVQLDASAKLPAVDGSQLTGIIPTQTGKSGTSLITNGTSVSWGSSIVSGTAQSSTSGTSLSFSGIPSWAKRITLCFYGTSLSGSADFLLQIGSGAPTTTGYFSASAQVSGSASSSTSSASGFVIKISSASATFCGSCSIENVTGNTWSSRHAGAYLGAGVSTGGGGVVLPGVLDQVLLTTTNGTDTFDFGTVNILWE